VPTIKPTTYSPSHIPTEPPSPEPTKAPTIEPTAALTEEAPVVARMLEEEEIMGQTQHHRRLSATLEIVNSTPSSLFMAENVWMIAGLLVFVAVVMFAVYSIFISSSIIEKVSPSESSVKMKSNTPSKVTKI
jgi:hypothetical protein